MYQYITEKMSLMPLFMKCIESISSDIVEQFELKMLSRQYYCQYPRWKSGNKW